MSDGLNRVMLLGNLGADPELRFTQGGQAVLNIRLATSERYLDRDKNEQERTEWHSVVVWGKRGEGLAKILRKGDRIFVEGGIRTSTYDDREGQKRSKTEIHATEVRLCLRRRIGAVRGTTPLSDYFQPRGPARTTRRWVAGPRGVERGSDGRGPQEGGATRTGGRAEEGRGTHSSAVPCPPVLRLAGHPHRSARRLTAASPPRQRREAPRARDDAPR